MSTTTRRMQRGTTKIEILRQPGWEEELARARKVLLERLDAEIAAVRQTLEKGQSSTCVQIQVALGHSKVFRFNHTATDMLADIDTVLTQSDDNGRKKIFIALHDEARGKERHLTLEELLAITGLQSFNMMGDRLRRLQRELATKPHARFSIEGDAKTGFWMSIKNCLEKTPSDKVL